MNGSALPSTGMTTADSPVPGTPTDDPEFQPVRFTPGVFVEGDQRPVHEMDTNSAQAAIDAAIGAERLDLGWVIVAYHSADIDGVSQREYRVIAWRQLRSEVGPTITQPTEVPDDAC